MLPIRTSRLAHTFWCAVLTCMVVAAPVQAAAESYTDDNGVVYTTGLERSPDIVQRSITVVPARKQIENLGPGDTYPAAGEELGTRDRRYNFTVFNFTTDTLILSLSTADGAAAVDSDSVISIVDDAEFGAGSWLSFPVSSIEVQPDQSAEVPVSIDIPEDAEPGSHYGIIRVVQGGSGSGGATSVGRTISLAMQYFFTIPGDVIRSGDIVATDSPGVIEYSTTSFAGIDFTWSNTGTVTQTLTGEIAFDSLFGNAVASLPVDEFVVIRGSERDLEVLWTDPPWIGRFTPVISVTGEVGETVTKELDPIWVIPPREYVYALLAAILLPLAWHIWRRRRERRRYEEAFSYDAYGEDGYDDDEWDDR